MLRYIMFVFTAVTAATLTGCATTTDNGDATAANTLAEQKQQVSSGVQPDWLSGESQEYPRLKYLTARGEGPDADTAIEQARQKLTGLFDVTAGGSDASFTPRSEVLPDLTQELAELQTDIKVATVWRDSETAQYHALATVPRKPAETYLTRKVNEIDIATGEILDQAKAAKDRFNKLSLHAQAWHMQSARSQLQAALIKADLTGQGVAPRWKPQKLQTDTEKKLKRLKIMPVAHEKYPLINSLSDGLGTVGLSSAKESNAEYMLQATLTISVSLPKSGMTQGQGKLGVTLVDKATASTVGTRHWEIAVDALDAIAAERRVLEKADFFIKKDMRDFLLDIAVQQP